MYKFLSHTADIKVEVMGDTLTKAFKESAFAMKESIIKNTEIKLSKEKKIKIGGEDLKSLLYNFLEEFLYLLDAKDFIMGDIQALNIDKKDLTLTAILVGDKASNYKISNDVKAITYSDMIIEQLKNKKYKLQFVLDV